MILVFGGKEKLLLVCQDEQVRASLSLSLISLSITLSLSLTHTVMWRCFSYTVVFLYLMEEETSLLIQVPAGIGAAIEVRCYNYQ